MTDPVTNTVLLEQMRKINDETKSSLFERMQEINNDTKTSLLEEMRKMNDETKSSLLRQTKEMLDDGLFQTEKKFIDHMQGMRYGLEQKIGRVDGKVEKLTVLMYRGFEEARLHRQALQEDLDASIGMLDRHDKKLARIKVGPSRKRRRGSR